MYPGSIFNLYDQSAIGSAPAITDNTYRPLFLSVGSFDKGYEGFNRVYGKDFYRIYGSKMYFSRHGQNAIQTANLINAGAECLIYRVVAEDSTLANLILVANVSSAEEQKEVNGNKIYIDDQGNETTEAIKAQYQKTDTSGNPLYKDPTTGEETTEATHQEQKKDQGGNLIYLDGEGNETTEATRTEVNPDTGETIIVNNDPCMITVNNEPVMITEYNDPVMITVAVVKWTSESVENAVKYEDVVNKAQEMFDPDHGIYPLMIFTDIGRGKSEKAVRLVPNYATSMTTGMMFYNLLCYEGTTQIDTTTVSFNPRAIYANKAYGLTKDSMSLVNSAEVDTIYDAYIEKLSSIIGIDTEVLSTYDMVYGYNTKGIAVPGFRLDTESADIRTDYGIMLSYGDNGSFGESPITDAYEELMDSIRAVYAGEKDERIYDVDEYRIVAVLDAGFSDNVKESIGELASFRKDFMFFRDMGYDMTNLMEITYKVADIKNKDRYTTLICTTYEVKDPVTLKNITVTANYDLATCLVKHFTDNAFAPLAGQFNGFVLDNAIEGTVNFVPLITPSVNQKQAIDDLRVNYAIFQGNLCTIQSEYTIQDEYTELSYTNNVIAIQEIMRAIRKYCPKIRFMTVDGYDMTAYAKAVNDLLSNYSNNFYRLYFEYTADILKASQKIFYATIKVQFRPWEQTEEFDIFALGLDADIDGTAEL